jgi:FMN phosphatase YigB (HAD superfamily)
MTGHVPHAVLLDVGGVLLLPDHGRITAAFERAEVPTPTPDLMNRAHFVAAARFSADRDLEGDWAGSWRAFLEDYVDVCTRPILTRIDRKTLHRHLDSEFADAALWSHPIEGVTDELRQLAETGLRLGVISNADGMIAQRLRAAELVHVGPGPGVEVGCIIDSGAVGVMKPDRRIFTMALEALDVEAQHAWYLGDMPAFDVVGAAGAGLRPWLFDPLKLSVDPRVGRVDSIGHLARIIGDSALA